MTRLAVIGDPIAHSVSPAMHRAALEACGLAWTYEAVRVTTADLPDAWPRLIERFAGFNVTRPLKEAIVALLDAVEGAAERTGSVNTVAVARERTSGTSTDGEGFIAALRRAGIDSPRRAVILGSGGAALAVADTLAHEGTAVAIAARNEGRRTKVAAMVGGTELGPDLEGLGAELAASDLLVNATPVGGEDTRGSPLPADALHDGLTVFDLVYRPRATQLLRDAARAGCRTVEGVEMLVQQGARSFETWTGRAPPIEAMHAAAVGVLDARIEESV